MNYFNGRFDVTDGYYYDENQYKIAGNVVDNSGNYFAADVQVGDIIYLDGSFVGVPLLRYKIHEIDWGETSGAYLSAIVNWDMIEGIEPQEPFGGMEGIIGALHSNGITANITPISYNSANELVIFNANSYQAMLLGKKAGGGSDDGACSEELEEMNKKLTSLEEQVKSVQLEWEDLFLLQ